MRAISPAARGRSTASPVVFRLGVAALLIALTLPRMAQRGMFGDGLLYATIARNLSIGSGSLWAPRYTETAWAEFYEHPPLGLALEAAAFWLLGDHLIVERAFSLIVFGLHALVIAMIWRRVQPAALDWLPLLFWLVPSIVTWGAVNNMLENTQALFTSIAILLLHRRSACADGAADRDAIGGRRRGGRGRRAHERAGRILPARRAAAVPTAACVARAGCVARV